MRGARLAVDGVTWAPWRNKATVLHNTSFSIEAGRVLGVVGPNGAGKTTLLRTLYRFLRPTTGQVRLDGEDLWQLSARAVAQRIAVVLQEQPSDFALTVEEIIALGRTPHKRGLAGNNSQREADIIHKALDQMGLHDLAHRHLYTLSGGERQRVMVARALAQEPRLLILDEPTNHLDIHHQLEVLELIRNLPFTIVTSLHDLNMASGVCDDVLLMCDGKPLRFGPPAEVLSERAVSDAINVQVRSETLSVSQTKHLTFHLH